MAIIFGNPYFCIIFSCCICLLTYYYYYYYKKKKYTIPLKGLVNFGSNCYMNSIIQCLFYSFWFRDKFLKQNFNQICQPISSAIQNVFKGLLNEKSDQPYNAFKFKEVLNENAKLFINKAGDPSDLILYLLDKIHNESKIETNYEQENINENDENEVYIDCKKSIDHSIISELFYGYYGEESKCMKCEKKYYLIEPKFLMQLNIKLIHEQIKKKSIKLDEYFKSYYDLESKKYFICPECGKQLANVKSYIKEFPKVLVIVLIKTEFPFKIEIQREFNFRKNKFILTGVSTIAYRPTSNTFGHAIAFCYHNRYFYKFDDSIVTKIDFDDFKNKEHYILFYAKV